MIEYGHDSQGGFYAIDEAERIAYYAYPSVLTRTQQSRMYSHRDTFRAG